MSSYCFKGWIYRRKLKYVRIVVHLIVPQSKFARSKMSPWILNGQQWKNILSLPLNAVTQLLLLLRHMPVCWMFPLVQHSSPCMPSTVCRLTVITSQMSWFDSSCTVSHSDSGCFKKYATFLLEMLAVSPRLQPWRLALMLMSCQLAWGWGK